MTPDERIAALSLSIGATKHHLDNAYLAGAYAAVNEYREQLIWLQQQLEEARRSLNMRDSHDGG